MSSATIGIDAVPRQSGWRSLRWMAPLAAFWVALTFLVPSVNSGGVPAVMNRLVVHVCIALGLWLGLERVELTPSQRRATWLAVMIPLTLWLSVAWSAAINGVFNSDSPLGIAPLSLVRFLPTIIAAPILLGSRRIGQLLDAMPAGWLVVLQVFRLQGAGFLVGWAHHTQPTLFALPVGIADVSVGTFAVPVAHALASGGRGSRVAAIAWNVFGLTDFTFAITVGTLIGLHLIETGFPSTISGYPLVMIAAFGVPQAILLHLVSLRQLLRRSPA
jgi:hypothetical protein